MVATATASDAATAVAKQPRLPYWPALDGLRGVDIVAVLFFHGAIGWAKGGFICVSIFFTMSGFLITSLVLSERQSSGTIRLTAFWARRIRRLVPASIAALLLAAVVTAIAVPAAQQASVANDIRASVLQFANWRFIAEGTVYADLTVVPTPVLHYWSLAIEEQFYLLFPIIALLALRRGRSTLGAVFAVATALSLWRQLSLDGLDRVYFGTDTRVAEIAVGGLLAIGYPRITALAAIKRWHLADVAGFAGLAATVAIFLGVPHSTLAIYDGGLAAYSIAAAMMVFAAIEGPIFRRMLSVEPLVGLGKISYGIYLYHFPIFVLFSEDRMGYGGMRLLALRMAVTLVLAMVSSHLLERPIRSGLALRGRRAQAAFAGALASVLLVAIPVGRLGDDLGPELSELPELAEGEVRPPRIVVAGDSTAAANGQGLAEWGERTGRLQVVTYHRPGCGPLEGVRFRIRDGYEFVPELCDSLFTEAARIARQTDADAIVVFIGSSQLADWEYADLEGFHHLGEPAVDQRYLQAVSADASTLEAVGVPVLWASIPTPEWDLDAFSRLVQQQIPGSGPVSLNDPPRTVRLNELHRQALARHPLVRIWDYAEGLAGPDGTVSRELRTDGVHVDSEDMGRLAEAWLFDALGAAYRDVVDARPDGLEVTGIHTWTERPERDLASAGAR